MTEAIKDLRKRLGDKTASASERNAYVIVVPMSDMRVILAALDELIEPAEKREVQL